VSLGSVSTVRLNYNTTSKIDQGSNLPKPSDKLLLPFEEIYIENTNYLGDYELSLVYNQRKESEANLFLKMWTWEEKWKTGGASFLYPFSSVHNVEMELEVQNYERLFNADLHFPENYDYWSQIVTLKYSWAPLFSMFVNVEHSDEKSVAGETHYKLDDYYVSSGLVIDFLEKHKLNILIGSEKGGKICRGGTCVDIKPFKGVRIELTSLF
jgi:hypothetical protein